MKASYCLYFFIYASVFSSNSTSAQPITKHWDQTFRAELRDGVHAMLATADGGVLIAGTSNSGVSRDKTGESRGGTDYWVIKLDANRVKQWDRTYGGNKDDNLSCIVASPSGGYLLGGTSNSDSTGEKTQDSHGGSDYWIVKIDDNGNKRWDRTLGGNREDVLTSLIVVKESSGYLLGGISSSDYSGDKTGYGYFDDYWIIRITPEGNKLWDKVYDGAFDKLRSIVTTNDGGYLLGGTSNGNIDGDKSDGSRGADDYWIIKIDSRGNKKWDKTYGGNSDDRLSVIVNTIDGAYLLAGTSDSDSSGEKSENHRGSKERWREDYWLIKIDDYGNKKWDKTFGGSGQDFLSAAITTTDNGYLIGGTSWSNSSNDKLEDSRGTEDFWIIKIDTAGHKQWDKTYGGSTSDTLYALVPTADGGFLLGGASTSIRSGDKFEDTPIPTTGTDYWIVKCGPAVLSKCGPEGCIGNPAMLLNPASGNMRISTTDLVLWRGIGQEPLVWRRYNNSQSTGNNYCYGRGNNWTHCFQYEINEVGEYDKLGRLKKMIYPDLKFELYDYDEVSNLKIFKNRAGNTQTSYYDNSNRNTASIWDDNITPGVSKTYDNANRLLTLSSSVSTLGYNYTDANELKNQTQTIAGADAKAINYTYTVDGLPETLKYPNGNVITYNYTGRNEIASIKEDGQIVASYQYDQNGNRISKELKNKTLVKYTNDDASRMLSIDNQRDCNSFIRFDYRYDNLNRKKFVQKNNDKGNVFVYDKIDQLTDIKYEVTNPDGTPSLPERTVNYSLDAAGNRNNVTDNNKITGYTSNQLNQYIQVGNSTLEYTENGNLKSRDGWTFIYDAQNRLTKMANDTTSIEIAYDANGRPVKRTVNGVTTFVYYDGSEKIEEIGLNIAGTNINPHGRSAGDTIKTHFIYGEKIGEILIKSSTVDTVYYHDDGNGKIVAVTDNTGNIKEQYQSDEFGDEPLILIDGKVVPLSQIKPFEKIFYPGLEYLPNNKLLNSIGAVYDAKLGQWVSNPYAPRQSPLLGQHPPKAGTGQGDSWLGWLLETAAEFFRGVGETFKGEGIGAFEASKGAVIGVWSHYSPSNSNGTRNWTCNIQL